MNQLTKLCVYLSVLLVLTGCSSLRTNTKPVMLDGNAVPDLNVSTSVALKNGSLNPGEVIIGKWTPFTVYGDYYQFTETAIGTTKNVLTGQGIVVENNASKSLELEVTEALSEYKDGFFSVTIIVEVKLGNGKFRKYTGIIKHGNGYGTTSAIENAIVRCVKEMLQDKVILDYLRE